MGLPKISQNPGLFYSHKLPAFTLLELLVVVTIMVMMLAALTLNLVGQRTARNIKIAQSRIVTDLRKSQSYTLAARTLPSLRDPQYYILKFNLALPDRYTIQGISDADTQPALEDVETVYLPSGVRISNVVVLRNPSQNPSTQNIISDCAIAAFSAPFGRIIFNDGCTPVNSSPVPTVLTDSDDYKTKIVNFLFNLSCVSYNPIYSPAGCSASTDSKMTITLSSVDDTLTKQILINGITGVICPTENGSSCLTSN